MKQQQNSLKNPQQVKRGSISAGVFMGANKKNRNGRIYPRELIEREVKNYQALIESREALGELSHPTSRRNKS